MYVVIVATKAAGADAIREVTRADHLRFMIGHRDRLAFGGSFQAHDGSWGGMALIVEATSVQDAEAWLAVEPYRAAGVFESVTIRPFRQLVPEPSAGLLADELRAEEAKQRGR